MGRKKNTHAPLLRTYTNAVSRSTRSPGRERPSPRRMLSPSRRTSESHSTRHAIRGTIPAVSPCLLYTSDAADDM
eukprot:6345250-Prymnesium_polylepis.2